jgi:invasion protein IalB
MFVSLGVSTRIAAFTRSPWRWIGILSLGALFAVPALEAAAAPKDGEKFKDWTAKCGKLTDNAKGEVCHIFQVLTDNKDTKKAILAVEIGYLPGEKEPIAQFTLPLGVLLPPGMQLRVDESEETGRVPFTLCDPVGCKAMVRLDDKVIARFKKGTKINVLVANPEGRVATIPISLSGFTAAFDSLK